MFISSNFPQANKIGTWDGHHKTYLTHTKKQGWRIEKFNRFQCFLKNLGFYPRARLTNIVNQLQKELKTESELTDPQKRVIEKLKQCWSKRHHSSFPLDILATTKKSFSFTQASKEVCELLKSNQGMIVAESHIERASMRFMIENMDNFQSLGVKQIFIEHLTEEAVEACKEYFSPNYTSEDFPDSLKAFILYHDVVFYGLIGKDCTLSADDALKEANESLARYSEYLSKPEPSPDDTANFNKVNDVIGQEKVMPYNLEKLFKCAKKHGISIVPLDTTEAKKYVSWGERAEKMNRVAIQAVGQREGKYLLCCGRAHAEQCEDEGRVVPGLDTLLGVPTIHLFEVSNKDECLTKRENSPEQPISYKLALAT